MKLSVVMPSYNQVAYLRSAIDSVLSQNYSDLEFWVIDGASTDGSVDLLEEFAGRGCLKYISERDSGQSDALNKGLALCRGEVICWLNSDDLYRPGALALVADYFLRHPSAALVAGDCEFIDERGSRLYVASGANTTRESMIRVKSIPYQPATFFRRSLLVQCGAVNLSLHYSMDYELWLRFTRHVKMDYLPYCLASYRLHPQSKSMKPNYSSFLPEVMKVSKMHWGSPSRPAYWFRLAAVRLHASKVYYEAALCFGKDDRRLGLYLLMMAIRYAPWRKLYWLDLLAWFKHAVLRGGLYAEDSRSKRSDSGS